MPFQKNHPYRRLPARIDGRDGDRIGVVRLAGFGFAEPGVEQGVGIGCHGSALGPRRGQVEFVLHWGTRYGLCLSQGHNGAAQKKMGYSRG